MKESLGKFESKLKRYRLNDKQIADIMDNTYHLAMLMAHCMAKEEVESALNSLARFGKL